MTILLAILDGAAQPGIRGLQGASLLLGQSPVRLAPKLLEQLELPLNTSAEQRLLRLIAKVPGLQDRDKSR